MEQSGWGSHYKLTSLPRGKAGGTTQSGSLARSAHHGWLERGACLHLWPDKSLGSKQAVRIATDGVKNRPISWLAGNLLDSHRSEWPAGDACHVMK